MTIVAAVDKSEQAEQVVEESAQLAEAFDEPIHVVHVMSRSEFVNLGRTRAEKGDPVDIDEVRKIAAEIASEAATGVNVPFETVGLVGDPVSSVVDYADKQDARYVVITGRKRSPVGKAILGSIGQSIILNATCSVVTVIQNRQ